MDLIEYLKNSFKLYFLDDKALEEISSNTNLTFGILGFLFINFISSLFIFLVNQSFNLGLNLEEFLFFLLGMLILLPFILGLLIFFAFLFHLILKLLKGKASFRQTLNMYFSLTFLPLILMFIYNLVAEFLFFLDVGEDNVYFLSFLILLIIGYISWSVVVICKSLAFIHKISMLKVLLAYFLFFLLLVLIFLIISILFSLVFIGLLGLAL